ncbi:MAG: dUTP diphosphatase [Acidimicrobiales bacterium]
MVALQIRRLDPDLVLPSYAEVGDAGADLVASETLTISAGGGRGIVGTGIAIAIPVGFAGFVQPRSGMALRSGVTVLNTPGLIDSGYRNEVKVILINTDPDVDYVIERGDRIAQLVIQRVERVEWEVVDELSESDRGLGGFGHSGR